MAKFDKKLGQILVKNGLLDEKKRQDLLSQVEQDESKSLARMLIESKLVNEDEMIGCISQEVDLPPINVARCQVAQDALDLIPEDLATYYVVLPVSKIGNTLTLAVANPFDVLTLDDVKIVTQHELIPVVSNEVAIRKAIERVYKKAEQAMENLFQTVDGLGDGGQIELTSEEDDDDAIDISSLESSDSPVVKLVNLVIFQAVKDGASDIHIEPFEKKVRIRVRIDGACQETISPPRKMHPAIVSRIKIMSQMDIAERHKPQDGKFQMRISGRQVDFRVSILPMVHGEKVVMRSLDTSSLTLSLDLLGFEDKPLNDFRKATTAAYGMVLVTGPTGSGKSTTLYSTVKEIMRPEDNITTVEDPVEYQIDGINQVPVAEKRGLSFAAALRSILRQDPDTVLIGEIRDLETADIAIKAALTGHLVLSTLHTNDAASTIARLVDMGIDPFMVSASVLLFSAQRLVRRLCKECKEAHEISKKQALDAGFRESELKNLVLYRPKGGPHCKTGYKGRSALLETVPMTDALRRIIVGRGSTMDVKKQALADGMLTLRRVGLLNAMRGVTSLEEILAITMRD